MLLVGYITQLFYSCVNTKLFPKNTCKYFWWPFCRLGLTLSEPSSCLSGHTTPPRDTDRAIHTLLLSRRPLRRSIGPTTSSFPVFWALVPSCERAIHSADNDPSWESGGRRGGRWCLCVLVLLLCSWACFLDMKVPSIRPPISLTLIICTEEGTDRRRGNENE